MNKKITFILLCLIVATVAQAQEDRNKNILKSLTIGLEYRLKAGFNIGGTSPIPLPVEIRKINSYKPTTAFSIEGDVVKTFDNKWGVSAGIRLETKGMETDATVKNYHMKMIASDGGEMEGQWTGGVTTTVKQSLLTVPVLAIYKVSKRWELELGPWFSYVLSGEFFGEAYDGYLRDGDPTGEKANVSSATYNFNDDLRRFQCGMQLGAQWRAFSHLNVTANLTWGVVPIFKKDFDTVTFNMFPIYGNIGFGYVF
ncbi:porin family protein [Bacteroides nordii]|uniref:porin family protein n=1 Tax=Bacteroides nordii TaxID=291645 RepID=UPI00203F9C54|nr:porin family protein [Bacteroides nordii]GFZ39786.1 membrane protein [Bacteroides nordii]